VYRCADVDVGVTLLSGVERDLVGEARGWVAGGSEGVDKKWWWGSR